MIFQIGDGVSLLLFSSEFLYDDMELLAVAEVSFCNPINDFSYQWNINGIESEEVKSVNGNSIRLPSSLLRSGQQIEIIVAVLNNQSMTMTSVSEVFNSNIFKAFQKLEKLFKNL